MACRRRLQSSGVGRVEAVSEFDIIRRYFSAHRGLRADVVLGVGDDGALTTPAAGMQLVSVLDTLVEGVHFFPDVEPGALGRKLAAVNLSDMAAMGAEPAWALLGLTNPDAEADWLARFSDGLLTMLRAYGVALIGGDTTLGARTVSLTMLGMTPPGLGLLRSGAQVDDDVWVSGQLGGAALALAHHQQGLALDAAVLARVDARLCTPQPRCALGKALRGLATAAIDISDGLLADLDHVLLASGVGARIDCDALPLHPDLPGAVADPGVRLRLALAVGDDYELLFTASAAQRAAIQALAQPLDLTLTRIGVVTSQPEALCLEAQGRSVPLPSSKKFNHFSN